VPQLARLPQVVQLPEARASAFPEPVETPTTAHSALDIALHPSLKYAHWTPSVAIARPSRAALDIPIAVYGQKTAALAASLKSSAKPVITAGDDDAQTRQLIDANLKMEEDRKFVMSMCQDQQGCLWVGTEGNGVQCFDPRAPELHQWTEFTTKDGLGDDYAYALACDRLGRIWAGGLRSGVSVFNGLKWQNYEVVGGLSRPDTLSGPLGERVFAIKVCPRDGDVWIATSCGLRTVDSSIVGLYAMMW
jgi:ligand-binding sensor domain-containing protein